MPAGSVIAAVLEAILTLIVECGCCFPCFDCARRARAEARQRRRQRGVIKGRPRKPGADESTGSPGPVQK